MSPNETKEPSPLITVIIPVYNMAGLIADCIVALKRQTLPAWQYEIIVVDDGSTDGSGQVAERNGATRVIYKPRGGYAAAARNMGIRAARGEILCFTDADCRPHPHWLAQIISPFAIPEIAGVKGVYTTEQRSFVARFVQLEYEEKYDRLLGQDRISFIDSYCAAFRRHVLISNDGFDEQFPVAEDRELSFRLATRGYQMVFQPQAAVGHLHADTLLDYFGKKVRNGYWVAQVVRRFPTHGVEDSYTPQSVKLQILLMALFFIGLGISLLTLWGLPLLIGSLVAFLLTAPPLFRRAWQHDRPLAPLVPFMLAVRATALGLGYAWGLVHRVDFDQKGISITGFHYIGKRSLDILAGVCGVTLTALILPVVALFGRGPGALLQQQTYLGQYGHIFGLRSFGKKSRLRGRWRKLPQFWHVLWGEMSLVGPRPETEEVVAEYQDWHRQRFAVKPGIITPVEDETASLDDRIRSELDYIASYSFWRDLKIIIKEM